MKQSDFNNILLHLLIDLQASVSANRDALFAFLANIPESPANDQWMVQMKNLVDGWDSNQKGYKDALIAGIRNTYDPNLGSIDDLLKGIDTETP